MGVSVDLENRDENDLNSHVKVLFEDVLAEPDGTYSVNCVWDVSYQCFDCGKNCCYKTLSALCGIFIALAWGCEFGCVIFQHIWFYTPCLRITAIYAACIQKYFGTLIACCLAPVCESCSIIFSRIHVFKQQV